jgi:CheY-like chemotaxis protein
MNSPDGNSKPANSRTVLVLDDDVLVRMPVVQLLRECGYRVVEAASTDEAIAVLQKTAVPVDRKNSGSGNKCLRAIGTTTRSLRNWVRSAKNLI